MPTNHRQWDPHHWVPLAHAMKVLPDESKTRQHRFGWRDIFYIHQDSNISHHWIIEHPISPGKESVFTCFWLVMKNDHTWPTLEPICARNTCNQRTESPAIFWALSNLSRSSWFTTTFKAPRWNGMPFFNHPILWICSNHITNCSRPNVCWVCCQTPHHQTKISQKSRCNHLIERCHPLFQQHLYFWSSPALHPQLSFPMLLE